MDKVAKSLSAAVKWLADGEFLIACVVLILLMSVESYETIARYAFHAPTKWSFDLVQFLMEFVTFLALARTQIKRAHVNVDLVVNHLPRQVRTALELLASAVGLVVFAVVSWQTWGTTKFWLVTKATSAGAAPLPLWISIVPVAIGSSILCLVLISDIYQCIVTLYRGQPESYPPAKEEA